MSSGLRTGDPTCRPEEYNWCQAETEEPQCCHAGCQEPSPLLPHYLYWGRFLRSRWPLARRAHTGDGAGAGLLEAPPHPASSPTSVSPPSEAAAAKGREEEGHYSSCCPGLSLEPRSQRMGGEQGEEGQGSALAAQGLGSSRTSPVLAQCSQVTCMATGELGSPHSLQNAQGLKRAVYEAGSLWSKNSKLVSTRQRARPCHKRPRQYLLSGVSITLGLGTSSPMPKSCHPAFGKGSTLWRGKAGETELPRRLKRPHEVVGFHASPFGSGEELT